MTRHNRPTRRKPDNLLEPDMRAAEAACHVAVAPFDRLARKMDRKWGIDRLPDLVSPDTAKRYGSALGRLNDAIRAANPDQCAHMAKVCMRGLAAMNTEAEEAGHAPPGLLAEFDLEGFHFGIIGETGDWAPLAESRPGLRLYSLREVAIALKHQHGHPTIDAVKQAFPQAQIGEPIKPLPKSFWDNGGDEIPI